MTTITTGNSTGRHKIKQWTGKNGTTQTSFLATAAFLLSHIHHYRAALSTAHVCVYGAYLYVPYIMHALLLLYALLVAFITRLSAKLPIVTKRILWQIPLRKTQARTHSHTRMRTLSTESHSIMCKCRVRWEVRPKPYTTLWGVVCVLLQASVFPASRQLDR